MEVGLTEHIPITDASSVGEARRRGLLLADRLGFGNSANGIMVPPVRAQRSYPEHAGIRGDLPFTPRDGAPIKACVSTTWSKLPPSMRKAAGGTT